ncbi:hypothetical protein AAGG74_16760 [Bacillus mexicanus]|uniref:hypothetical protein n=1 Tax=Bacillus mexicanus TaxID=2834415 RepID=UPI003D20B881
MEKNIRIKHEMDKEARMMTLDEAFFEALQLSEGRSSDIENQEYALFEYLSQFPEFVQNISEQYKKNVLEKWGFKVLR